MVPWNYSGRINIHIFFSQKISPKIWFRADLGALNLRKSFYLFCSSPLSFSLKSKGKLFHNIPSKYGLDVYLTHKPSDPPIHLHPSGPTPSPSPTHHANGYVTVMDFKWLTLTTKDIFLGAHYCDTENVKSLFWWKKETTSFLTTLFRRWLQKWFLWQWNVHCKRITA